MTNQDNLAQLEEQEVIRRAVEGDTEAFGVLYQRYIKPIYNYVYYRTGNVHDAEDISARVFHRAYSNISRFQYTGVPVSAWLYRIAHNLVANYHRDGARNKEICLEDQIDMRSSGFSPEESLEVFQEDETLMAAIRRLTPERQQVLILKFVENLSNNEIAVIMGRSEGAIKSLYHRTLIALKAGLLACKDRHEDCADEKPGVSKKR